MYNTVNFEFLIFNSPEPPVKGDEELLVCAALSVPAETIDVCDCLIEGTQLIELGEGALHQFGILTEELALVQETVAQ